jgi:hypothetical protein
MVDDNDDDDNGDNATTGEVWSGLIGLRTGKFSSYCE